MKPKYSFMCRLVPLVVMLILIFSNIIIAQEIKIVWGHTQPPTHPSSIAIEEVKNEIADKTNGRINIEHYPAAQLGTNQELIEGLIMGTNDMGFEGGGILGNFFDKMYIFDAPYLIKDLDHAGRLVNSEPVQSLFNEFLEKTGIRILDVWHYGVRHVTTKGKDINTIDDLKGLKMRVLTVPLMIDNASQLFDVIPTPMPFAELYVALQTGAVEAQENPLALIDSAKLYEVQDTVMLTGHVTNLQFVMIREEFWNKLSDEDKEILADTVKAAGNKQDEAIYKTEEKLVEGFIELGLNVVEVDEKDMAVLQERAAKVYEKYSHIWGSELTEQIRAVE